MSQRIDWQGGWAELTTELTHGRRMRIVRVLPKAGSSEAADLLEFSAELAAAHVVAWSLGEVGASGADTTLMDAMPAAAVDELTAAAIKLWTGGADPNVTTPTSDAGASESA